MAKGNTTIKVSRKIVKFIQSKAVGNEAIDTVLRRLLNLSANGEGPPEQPPDMTIIKISRVVMNKVVKEAKESESRSETLARLLGIARKT